MLENFLQRMVIERHSYTFNNVRRGEEIVTVTIQPNDIGPHQLNLVVEEHEKGVYSGYETGTRYDKFLNEDGKLVTRKEGSYSVPLFEKQKFPNTRRALRHTQKEVTRLYRQHSQ